jgi:hypothetical protein
LLAPWNPSGSGGRNRRDIGTLDAAAGAFAAPGCGFASDPKAASDMGSVDAGAAAIFGLPPRTSLARAAQGLLARACSAIALPKPPGMPPRPNSGANAFASGGICPNALGRVGGSQVVGSEDRKIGGCQAIAPARLAGICDQKA